MAFNDTTNVFFKHPSVVKLHELLKLEHYSGYVSLINPYKDSSSSSSSSANLEYSDWILFDVRFGIPLFDRHLNKRILDLFKENKLGRLSNLRRMLEANRALSLRLVDFIQSYQTLSVLDEKSSGDEYLIRKHGALLSPHKLNTTGTSGSGGSGAAGMVIYPTQCVLFMDAKTKVYSDEY